MPLSDAPITSEVNPENNLARLIVFTRYPQPGKAKTRLIPVLGAEGAAALQRQMTELTLNQVQKAMNLHRFTVEIWFAGTTSPELDRTSMQNWLGRNWVYQTQGAGDLGTKLSQAFQVAFAEGMKRVVTIGTDCPELDTNILIQAFRALEDHDLVLGPATDGGYYLIGLRQFVPELFADIAWSTAVVLQQTIDIAEQAGLSIAYLDALTDIDRPEDLPVWQTAQAALAVPEISVIIPVLNEANQIQSVLRTLHTAYRGSHQPEIIIVDGGSQDDTVALAKQAGARVITTELGRAHQLNAGASIATGKILLFLHADTCLPDGFDTAVQQILAQSGVSGGAFQLQIDGKEPGLRLVEWGVKWRSLLLQLPYGDQALFLKTETFQQLGGFPELPIMEDFVFVRRLQAKGRVAIVSAPVITSARRWQKVGIFKTTLINQLVILAYFLGVPLKQIARWYRGRES